MRAAVYTRYGGPERLTVTEVPRPDPGDGDVLVAVKACALNAWDWDLLKGHPLGRLGGLFAPSHRILGADIAGVVKAVGRNVTRFRPGDAVMGDVSAHGWGGLAEYVTAPADILAVKPDALSFAQAAGLPQAGTLAYQAMYEERLVRPGEQVLINGAGGGVGSFAVQMAKHLGAVVTGVDSACKLDFMQELGADHVMDYRHSDYARTGKRYDLIVDMVAQHGILAHARALAEGGTFCMVGGSASALLQTGLIGPAYGKRLGKKLGLLMWRNSVDQLEALLKLVARGAVTPMIDAIYPLEDVAMAFRHIGQGHAKGKIVLSTEI